MNLDASGDFFADENTSPVGLRAPDPECPVFAARHILDKRLAAHLHERSPYFWLKIQVCGSF